MDKRLFAFSGGVSTILLWPWLPEWELGLLLLGLSTLCIRRRPMMACLLLGMTWALCYSHWQLNWWHYPQLFQRSQLITGSVASVQHREQGASRLIVSLSHLNGQALSPQPKVLLAWYSEQATPKVGDRLQTISHLKLPHGLHNPGTFDSARWLLGQGITARGSVTGTLSHQRAPPSRRSQLVADITSVTEPLTAQPWLLALSVGERGGLTSDDWAMLRGLGVSHLFAISGLHIGLVAGLGLVAGRLLGWRNGALLLGAGLGLTYAWLAGFSIPTQRALVMLMLWLGLMVIGRFWSGRRVLLVTMTMLLATQPWLALNQGFWLSVLAVAAVIAVSQWFGGRSLWRLQAGLTLLLLPIVMLFFGGLSWLSLPVNLILIPLFSLLLIPLLLLASLLLYPAPELAWQVFSLLNALFEPLMAGLHWLNNSLSPWQSLSAKAQGVGFALLLLPFCLLPQARALSVLAITVVLLSLPATPGWEVRALDVGQGLSVLVTQGDNALLYDTGNRFNSGFNMADAVILPLLARLGIKELDYLVISHDDRDHSGNRDYLAKVLPIAHRWGAWPDGQRCRAGQRAQWGKLQLTVLWPTTLTGHSNNDSCVVHISDGRRSVLLTGDIEAKAEQTLLATGQSLQAELLFSPHHGSRSSSTEAFNRAVAPDWVIHTAGFANQWGFPSPEVVARFEQQDVEQLTTGELGMVHFVAKDSGWQLRTKTRPGVWYHQLNTWLQTAKPLE